MNKLKANTTEPQSTENETVRVGCKGAIFHSPRGFQQANKDVNGCQSMSQDRIQNLCAHHMLLSSKKLQLLANFAGPLVIKYLTNKYSILFSIHTLSNSEFIWLSHLCSMLHYMIIFFVFTKQHLQCIAYMEQMLKSESRLMRKIRNLFKDFFLTSQHVEIKCYSSLCMVLKPQS